MGFLHGSAGRFNRQLKDNKMKIMSDTPEERPDNAAGRPMVTFALFAYNQEDFIREAIEGAFSQTYEPLEIILSDDCSSDRTFEIMQQMAAEYVGPHILKIRRNNTNVGTLNHVLSVAHDANGEYMVVAAGDDISLKERVVRTIEFMELDHYCAVSTSATIINGQQVSERQDRTTSVDTRYEMIFQNKIKRIYGATAAYRVDCLPEYRPDIPRVLTEDFFLELLFYYDGLKIGFLDQPSILYRFHENSTSVNFDAKGLHQIMDRERRIIKSKLEYAKSYRFLLKHISCKADFSSSNPKVSEISLRAQKRIEFLKKRSNWYDMGFLEKIFFIPFFIKNDGFISFLPRAFGLKTYALASTFKDRLVKKYK